MNQGDESRRTEAHLGAAALSVCESLLLALQDRGVLDAQEVDGLLEDVEAAHRNVTADGADRAFHDTVADILVEIRNGGNSVRMVREARSTPPASGRER